jgi:sugar phosphate permease
VLAVGTAAQASAIALLTGPSVLAPELRDELGLSLTEIGVVIAAPWVGPILTLLPWGILADRVGERIVLAVGLALCGVLTIAIAFTTQVVALALLLAFAGGAGASTNAASGRAVMSWFGAEERGFALGIRQASTPLGITIAALVLPALERAGGLESAFAFLAALALGAALAGAVVVRDLPAESGAEHAPHVLRNRDLWLLGASGGLYLIAQVAVVGFLVLFLHDERGISTQAAAAVLAVIQALAIAFRIVVGRWSDLAGGRVGPLRLLGIGASVSLATTAVLLEAPTWAVLVSFVVAGTLAMSWNGLSFTAAAELAGRARSGAAIGFQQTVLSATAAASPPVFAAVVEAESWRTAFLAASIAPLVGWALLAPLDERRGYR